MKNTTTNKPTMVVKPPKVKKVVLELTTKVKADADTPLTVVARLYAEATRRGLASLRAEPDLDPKLSTALNKVETGSHRVRKVDTSR